MTGVTFSLCADDGRPVAALEAELRAPERMQAQAFASRRRRHFVLGRLAAHAAIGQLRACTAEVWVAADMSGAPAVAGGDAGLGIRVGIGIAHSSMLAVACAWPTDAEPPQRVGIDVERIRPTEVASSRYAFSRSERRLLRASGLDRSRAGLLAWVAKEAAWKAIRFSEDVGPDALEVRRLDVGARIATVVVRRRRRGAESDPPTTFRVRLRALAGPDGEYIMAIAKERTTQ